MRKWASAALATVLAGAAVLAVAHPIGFMRTSSGTGSIDVFVGSTPTPSATPSGNFDLTQFRQYGASASAYSPATCTTTISSGVATAISNAAGGAVICLSAAGSPYPTITTSASKSSDVIVQAVAGESVSINSLQMQSGGSHLTFQGLSIDGGQIYGTTHVHLKYDTFTSATEICGVISCTAGGTVVANADVTVEHARFDNIQNGISGEARLNLRGNSAGNDSGTPNGFQVSYSHFGGTGLNGGSGGCSDGVDIHGNATGVKIGPGNEFDHLYQGSCATINTAHVDPIEVLDPIGGEVYGNYFHDNSDGSGGLGWFSGSFGHFDIHDNVWVCGAPGVGYAWPVSLEGATSDTYYHNVLVQTNGCRVRIGRDNQCDDSGTMIFQNNVWTSTGGTSGIGWDDTGCTASAHAYTEDHNLNCSCGAGTGDTTGTPTFAGGATPTTWEGYALAAGSPGKGAASGGTDMGITP